MRAGVHPVSRWLQSRAMSNKAEEVRVEKLSNKGKGRGLILIVGPCTHFGVMLLCWVAMSLMYNEWKAYGEMSRTTAGGSG